MRVIVAFFVAIVGVVLAFEAAAGQGANPRINSLNPGSIAAGAPTFTLTVDGSNFRDGAVVRWNGFDRTTERKSDNQLLAMIYAGDIAQPGSGQVTVAQPAGNQIRVSDAVVFPITAPASNPIPMVTALLPASAPLGRQEPLELVVRGANFVQGAAVRWGTAVRTTTRVSTSELKATIPAGDFSAGGLYPITVYNPAPGGGLSTAIQFTVLNPLPVMSALSPASAATGSGDFTLTVDGSDFVPGAQVLFREVARPTTFVSSTRLRAAIPGSDLITGGGAFVRVANPPPGGGTVGAGRLIFMINIPTPTISSIAPATTARGGTGFVLTVKGSSFFEGSRVRWNGANRTTEFVSATELRATIPASDLTTSGNAAITAVTTLTSTTGGQASSQSSAPAILTILEPVGGTATVSVSAPTVTRFHVGGSGNPERVLAGQPVPLYASSSGATPSYWRVSPNTSFSGATWQSTATTRSYTFPTSLLADATGVESTLYFQFRGANASDLSNTMSDAVIVRKPFSTTGTIPNLWGKTSSQNPIFGRSTSDMRRIVCNAGQVMTGVQVKQGLWIDAIGITCAGADPLMVGNTAGGTLLTGTACTGTNVPGPYALTDLGTFLRFDRVTCESNVFGQYTFDPLYARVVGGGASSNAKGCVTSASAAHPDAKSAPIGLDVHLYRTSEVKVGSVVVTPAQTGVAGLAFICAQPD